MLNLIKGNLGKCTNQVVKSKAYTWLVQSWYMPPQVWDPYQKTLIHKIEMIQRSAARWVYDYCSSVSTMLNDLNWPTLEDRHKENRLSPLAIQNHPASRTTLRLDIPSYYLPPPDDPVHILRYQHLTPFINRPATSTEQLKIGTSCHYQCINVSKNDEPQRLTA